MARTCWPSTCEPRPLAQAGQISRLRRRVPEPGTRPTDRYKDSQAASADSRVRPGPRPDTAPRPLQNQGSRAVSDTTPILPAESAPLPTSGGSGYDGTQNIRICVRRGGAGRHGQFPGSPVSQSFMDGRHGRLVAGARSRSCPCSARCGRMAWGWRRGHRHGWWRAIAGGPVDSSPQRYTIILWS